MPRIHAGIVGEWDTTTTGRSAVIVAVEVTSWRINMLLEIKKVRKCRKGEAGYFVPRTSQKAYIAISEDRNPTLDAYAATLLHELLHFYTALLEVDGFRVSQRKEHDWIYDCEKKIIRLMKKYMGRKTK